MERSTDKLIEVVKGFIPFAEDDMENDNVDFLYDLTGELLNSHNSSNAINPLFELLEKYPKTDFGSPGPIVHFIENFTGEYETWLYESLERKPVRLTILMLNRIINSDKNKISRTKHLQKLTQLLTHPKIEEAEKELIMEFKEFQTGK